MQLIDSKVRLLQWCINSPELAHTKQVLPLIGEADSELNQWLLALDQKPDSLHRFLETINTKRLGLYFESLWQFYLENGPNWQLLKHNWQIIEEKQTLGELDVLAFNPSLGYLHMELAVKFYLQHPNHSGQECHHWLGPQSRDRLDIKLKTLNERQFPILHHPQCQALLANLKIKQPIHQRLIFKGYLFNRFQNAYSLPTDVNPLCNMGEWLHQKYIAELTQGHDTWSFVKKSQWLGPLKLPKSENKHLIMGKEKTNKFVHDHFAGSQGNYALMLIKLIENQNEYAEINRYFIMDDAWPNA